MKNNVLKKTALTCMVAMTLATGTMTAALPVSASTGKATVSATQQAKCDYTVKAVKKTMTVKSDVFVRKGPKTSYDKMGALSKGTKVKVTGQVYKHGNKACWVRINYKGKTGYVCTDYLK